MRIVIACGGTGGHVLAARTLAEEMTRRACGVEVLFVSDGRGEGFLKGGSCRTECLDIRPFEPGINVGTLLALPRLFSCFGACRGILKRCRAGAVVGFGGYVSAPAVTAAWSLGIKTLIFEQNVVPGRANRLLGCFASAAAVNFDVTAESFSGIPVRVTGNPVGRSLAIRGKTESRRALRLHEDVFTLLVMGGSQGAHALNTGVVAALKNLPEAARGRIQVIHIAGKVEAGGVREAYSGMRVNAVVFGFTDEMGWVYGASDLAVCRAGAGTLTELAYTGLPSILVPYPFAGGHQKANAEYFSRRNAAILIEQERLSPEFLCETVNGLFEDSDRLSSMRKAALGISRPDAAGKLADFVFEIAGVPHGRS